jgi:hypothetical protein
MMNFLSSLLGYGEPEPETQGGLSPFELEQLKLRARRENNPAMMERIAEIEARRPQPELEADDLEQQMLGPRQRAQGAQRNGRLSDLLEARKRLLGVLDN